MKSKVGFLSNERDDDGARINYQARKEDRNREKDEEKVCSMQSNFTFSYGCLCSID